MAESQRPSWEMGGSGLHSPNKSSNNSTVSVHRRGYALLFISDEKAEFSETG